MDKISLSQAIGKRIMELASVNDYSLKILCELSNVPLSSVKNLIYDKTTFPNTAIVYNICNFLEISLSDFFDSKIFQNIK